MLVVSLIFIKNVAHTLTAFEFACTIVLILLTAAVQVVLFHVAIYVLLALD
jgi:hypothetical protein